MDSLVTTHWLNKRMVFERVAIDRASNNQDLVVLGLQPDDTKAV
jgi:hypothetical protein